MSDPKAAFARALARLRGRLPDVSDEALARRASVVVLPSGRRVAVNARRLGEWVGGQSVPRDFDVVLAVALASGGVPELAELRELWRAAHRDRRATPKSGRVVVGRPPSDAAALRDRADLADAIDTALREPDLRQVLLHRAGHADEAVEELRAVLAEMSAVQGDNHPRTREAADLPAGWHTT
ncbi:MULTISPECIES: hypothetical protein [Saccharothrix]|uniref:hypothetical protein n=1 Tax=Saccharothrix TaxID=2071 RepID=UPI00093E9FB5|nr:hypothetical protein [Saccharothrix sp. CB00851]